MKKVAQWSVDEVSRWLTEEGMQEYSEPFRNVDGHALLQLSHADFQRPPLSLVSSDGGQQLLERVETLRIEHHIEVHKNGHANGHAILDLAEDLVVAAGDGNTGGNKSGKRNGMVNGYHKDLVQIPMPEPARSQFPTEWGKTAVAFFYAICCFVSTTIMISVVHERVPPKEVDPPLPDKFFDFFDRVEWAFSICEINGIILVCLWLAQWILLKYKWVISLSLFHSFFSFNKNCWRCIIDEVGLTL